jgi:lipoprotein-releasing system ATP-binding protein
MSDASNAAPPPAAPALRAEGVERAFDDGTRVLKVLRGATLELRAGEVVALVGRSGSGKSTLLHLLGLLDCPDAGEVLLDGTPTTPLAERQRAEFRNRLIGFVFQHYFLLPEFDVLENVMLPARVAHSPLAWPAAKRGARERARDILERVGLAEQVRQRPATLSGGERQRVALARALMLAPRVLLCDEPTGNLDLETAARIMDLIFELSRREGVAALVVTHDKALTERADRVLRLDAGRLHPWK